MEKCSDSDKTETSKFILCMGGNSGGKWWRTGEPLRCIRLTSVLPAHGAPCIRLLRVGKRQGGNTSSLGSTTSSEGMKKEGKKGVGRAGPDMKWSRKVGKIDIGAEGKVLINGGCAGRYKAYNTM